MNIIQKSTIQQFNKNNIVHQTNHFLVYTVKVMSNKDFEIGQPAV